MDTSHNISTYSTLELSSTLQTLTSSVIRDIQIKGAPVTSVQLVDVTKCQTSVAGASLEVMSKAEVNAYTVRAVSC